MEPLKEQTAQEPKIDLDRFEADDEGFVNFGEVSRSLLGRQSQYGSRYVDGGLGGTYPTLGEGLKIQGSSEDYHSMRIHKEDIEEFVRRFKSYEEKLANR